MTPDSRLSWLMHRHQLTIHMRIVRMVRLGEMMIFNEEKDGESERYAMIFIADLTPPPALCPYINGSAVLKSDDKLSRKTKCW